MAHTNCDIEFVKVFFFPSYRKIVLFLFSAHFHMERKLKLSLVSCFKYKYLCFVSCALE